jgi:hypothetical protein
MNASSTIDYLFSVKVTLTVVSTSTGWPFNRYGR